MRIPPKGELHQCEGIAKSTKKRCKEYAWMTYKGKYYCGNHYPKDPNTGLYLRDE